ncbi:MAG TPA: murein biosynthesis integral membrane protein MurJ [Terriglobia bacterium]|nr:murein biosynthesis integral membrane protein MurJ [Terriglobia bacterium]
MNSPSVTRRIAQASGIVMASVLASRVLGFFREWTVAHQIGSNAITDAYYAAFTLPDFLNYLVAGGSLSITFIPVFTKFVAENREDEGWHVFSTVVTSMAVLLTALIVVGEFYAAHLVNLIAPGFSPAEKARVVFLTRLMLPAQLCFYQGSILSAVQYAKGQFVVPSLAPLVYNVGIILGGVLLSPRIGITGFAVGVLGGAVAGNFLLQVYGASRAGARFSPNLDVRHPGFWLFIKLTVPIMLALSLVFTDDWIIRWFGSYLVPASITWLSYAKNLMRVPLGAVGGAIGVASFPYLAQLYSEGKLEELNRTLNATLKGLILLLLPISALTIAQSTPLVYLVFSHTRLRAPDLNATGATLAVFSLGMFAWGAQNILARGFYAARDTLTPAIVGTVLTFLNLPVYGLLMRRYQHIGLALASSLGIVAYTLILFFLLNRRTKNPDSTGMVWFFLKVASASALAAGLCFKLTLALHSVIGWQTTLHALAVNVIVGAVGFAVTGLLVKLFRVRELDDYVARLRR